MLIIVRIAMCRMYVHNVQLDTLSRRTAPAPRTSAIAPVIVCCVQPIDSYVFIVWKGMQVKIYLEATVSP